MVCKPDEEEQAALCYTPCHDVPDQGGLYYGEGPVCWEHCPASLGTDAGALCCLDAKTCDGKIMDLSKGVFAAILEAIAAGEGTQDWVVTW